jgi:DHA2 family multidrug resistance protein
MSGSTDRANWKPRANPWLIAVVVTLAAFMEVLDTTIVNVSLPYIAGDLASSYDDSTWTLTSYLAANGIVLTVSGYLARVLGRKLYFMICISMFTVCSFLCGIATNLPELIIFRLLQGFFGGGLQPNQQSIILDTFPPARRGAAFGLTALATVVAPVLGPTIGGYLTFDYSWRWVFFLNVPIGLFATFMVATLVEDPPWAKRQKNPGLDFVGLSLITLGLGCLEVMMDRGEDDDWFGSPFIRLMATIAVLGILGAIGWLLQVKKPSVNLRVLTDRNFATGFVAISALGFTLYAAAVVIPQFAQQVLGYNAILAGLILSPGAIVIIVLIPFVGRLLPRVQTRILIATGFFLTGCAMLYSSSLEPDIDFRSLVYIRAFQTVGLAFLFVPISTITYSTIPRELNGDASALFTMGRNVIGAIGISIANSQVTERTQVREAYLAHWATPFRYQYNNLVDAYRRVYQAAGTPHALLNMSATHHALTTFRNQAQILAYNDVFSLVAILAFIVTPLCMLFSPSKGGGGARGGH